MRPELAHLLDILDLERLEENLFRGRSPREGWQRVFGGQVIGQALVAATRTVVAARPAHSLHGYFLRPGDPTIPIIYEVERLRDGGSFSTRRVLAIQHGAAIFALTASFHGREEGLEHAVAAPSVAGPDALPDGEALQTMIRANVPEHFRGFFIRDRAIELRPTDMRHYLTRDALAPEQTVWVRAVDRLPDDPAVHQAVLAYISDMTLLDTAFFAHGTNVFAPDLQSASLDHAMWFHRPFRADAWLLYATDSPSAQGARGFTRGFLFDEAGGLIASTAQEGLMRRRTR